MDAGRLRPFKAVVRFHCDVDSLYFILYSQLVQSPVSGSPINSFTIVMTILCGTAESKRTIPPFVTSARFLI